MGNFKFDFDKSEKFADEKILSHCSIRRSPNVCQAYLHDHRDLIPKYISSQNTVGNIKRFCEPIDDLVLNNQHRILS